MLYLTHCRMPLAAARLAAGAATVSAVSSAVGYESEAEVLRPPTDPSPSFAMQVEALGNLLSHDRRSARHLARDSATSQ